jgi:hypothetical protein
VRSSQATGLRRAKRLRSGTTAALALAVLVWSGGCGLGAPGTASARAPAQGIATFEDEVYSAYAFNPGSRYAFTAFGSAIRIFTIQPSSAASVDLRSASRLRLLTPDQVSNWANSGRPSLAAPKPQVIRIPVGEFSFTTQGAIFTYKQAAALPASPGAIYAAVRQHLEPQFGADPPPEELLLQLGFIVATAPLRERVRMAAWSAILAIPHSSSCAADVDPVGRRGEAVCVSGQGYETEIIFNSKTLAVLAIEQRLTERSALYPGVAKGEVFASYTFT